MDHQPRQADPKGLHGAQKGREQRLDLITNNGVGERPLPAVRSVSWIPWQTEVVARHVSDQPMKVHIAREQDQCGGGLLADRI